MYKSKVILLTLLLLCIAVYCLGQTTQDIVYTKKETLFSTKNGSAIGDVQLSIAPKTATQANNEWLLIIGSQGGKFVDARNETTLWIFSKQMNANQLRRDLRNQDYTLEVRGFNEFMPFSENEIRFTLKEWEELRRQTPVSFSVNASPGEKVTLRLVFYTATADRRRTTIEDEAKVRIEFEIPDLSSRRSQTQQSGVGSGQEGEVISLTERIDPAAAAAARLNAQNEESFDEGNRGERMALVNSFIAERQREINALQDEVNAMLDQKEKVSESFLDSLYTIANEMKNRVDFLENGYSDILLSAEDVHDRFSKFRIAHTLTLKKIDELKDQQNPLSSILAFIKLNPLLSLGGGAGGFFILMLLQKLIKKMIAKGKSKVKQQMGKMKSDAMKKAKEPKKWMQRKKKKESDNDNDELNSIDINDLAEI